MRSFDDDKDFAIAELLRRAYGRTVGMDTAARHLWAIDAAARAARAPDPKVGRSRRVLVAALTSLMLVVSSGVATATVVASESLPGDVLYSLKRGSERARLVLAVRPGTDSQVHLAIARTRWDEAQRAAGVRPDVVPGLLRDTFDALQAAERGGVVAAEVVALRTQVTAASAELAFGEGRLPHEGAADRAPPVSSESRPQPSPSPSVEPDHRDVATTTDGDDGSNETPDPATDTPTDIGTDLGTGTEPESEGHAAPRNRPDSVPAEPSAAPSTPEPSTVAPTSPREPAPPKEADREEADGAGADRPGMLADGGATPESGAMVTPPTASTGPVATGDEPGPARATEPPTAPRWGRPRP